MPFSLGDEVICITDFQSMKIGCRGVVVVEVGEYSSHIGVRVHTPFKGCHDLLGRLHSADGYWVLHNYLAHLSTIGTRPEGDDWI